MRFFFVYKDYQLKEFSKPVWKPSVYRHEFWDFKKSRWKSKYLIYWLWFGAFI